VPQMAQAVYGAGAISRATRGAYLPFNSHCYFGAVRLHLDTAGADVPIVGRQPPPVRRFVAAIHPEAFLFEPFLRRPHIKRKRGQLLLKFFRPVIWICCHLRPIA